MANEVAENAQPHHVVYTLFGHIKVSTHEDENYAVIETESGGVAVHLSTISAVIDALEKVAATLRYRISS